MKKIIYLMSLLVLLTGCNAQSVSNQSHVAEQTYRDGIVASETEVRNEVEQVLVFLEKFTDYPEVAYTDIYLEELQGIQLAFTHIAADASTLNPPERYQVHHDKYMMALELLELSSTQLATGMELMDEKTIRYAMENVEKANVALEKLDQLYIELN